MENSQNLPHRNLIEIYFEYVTPYHYYYFVFIFFAKMLILYHILNLLFLSPPMSYHCLLGDGNATKDLCPCENVRWDRSVFTETMQTKYNILCDNKWLVSFSQSAYYGGLLVGAMIFGVMSDKYGRLFTMSLGFLLIGIGGCLVTVMPEVYSYIVFRCVEAVATGGCVVTAFVLLIEFFSSKHRETVTPLIHLPVNLGHLTMGGISYLLRNCDHYQLAITIPAFLIAASYWLLLESPKWLMDVCELEKCTVIMQKICKFNKKPCENLKEDLEDIFQSQQRHEPAKKFNFLEIFKHKTLAVNFLVMSYIFFVTGACHYGIAQYIGMMSGDIHLNITISGTLLFPGTIASIFLLKILPRRLYLASTMFISSIIMFTIVGLPLKYPLAKTLLACLCNSTLFMSFITIFLYGVEIFPTSVRSTALGALSVLSRVGQMTAPLINILPQDIEETVFAILALVSAILCYFLPETKNKELPSTYEDAEEANQRRSSILENKIKQIIHPKQATKE